VNILNKQKRRGGPAVWGLGEGLTARRKKQLVTKFYTSTSISFVFPTILPVVLYGCGTWFLTLREEHRLRVCENGVPRRIFGPKREEVAGGCRGLHNEELHKLSGSPNIIRVIKSRSIQGGACSTHGRHEKCIQNFGWNT
jgi:hypothetical protein